jgi:hypothetical protein
MAANADPVVIADETCRITLHPPRDVRRHGLEHRLDVVAGSFRGLLVVDCYARAHRIFHQDLSTLHRKLSGEARLEAYENLQMVFSGDGQGHIAVKVLVYADHERPIRLEFRIFLDQTELPQILRQVEDAFIRDIPPDH